MTSKTGRGASISTRRCSVLSPKSSSSSKSAGGRGVVHRLGTVRDLSLDQWRRHRRRQRQRQARWRRRHFTPESLRPRSADQRAGTRDARPAGPWVARHGSAASPRCLTDPRFILDSEAPPRGGASRFWDPQREVLCRTLSALRPLSFRIARSPRERRRKPLSGKDFLPKDSPCSSS